MTNRNKYQAGVALLTAVDHQGNLASEFTRRHLEWLRKIGVADWVIIPGTCGNRDELSNEQRLKAVRNVIGVGGLGTDRMLVDVSGASFSQVLDNASAVMKNIDEYPHLLLLPMLGLNSDQQVDFYVKACEGFSRLGFDASKRKVLIYDLSVFGRGFDLSRYAEVREKTCGMIGGCKRSDNDQHVLLELVDKFPEDIFTTGMETAIPDATKIGRCTVGIANCLPKLVLQAANSEPREQRHAAGYLICQVIDAILRLAKTGDAWQLGFKYLVSKLTPFMDYPVYSPVSPGTTLSEKGRAMLDQLIGDHCLLDYAILD